MKLTISISSPPSPIPTIKRKKENVSKRFPLIKKNKKKKENNETLINNSLKEQQTKETRKKRLILTKCR
jgi:hypothetical protein